MRNDCKIFYKIWVSNHGAWRFTLTKQKNVFSSDMNCLVSFMKLGLEKINVFVDAETTIQSCKKRQDNLIT